MKFKKRRFGPRPATHRELRRVTVAEVQELERRALYTGSGQLMGSCSTNPATVDLTAQGTSDWSHWGDYLSTDPVYKSSDGSPTNFSTVGTPNDTGVFTQFTTSFGWSDGTPISSNSGDGNGVWMDGDQAGFQIVLPADTTPRLLKLYVSAYDSDPTLTATLSDDSADAYVDSSVYSTGATIAEYDLTYSAASAGQSLTVQWVQTDAFDDSSYISLEAFSLAEQPSTPTDLAVSSATPNSVNLQWTASPGATSYNILREGPGDDSFTQYDTTSGTTYTDSGVDPGTSYQYEVEAGNSAGTSGPTDPLAAPTPPGLSLSDDGSVDEGDTYTLNVTPQYSGDDPITSLSIDWGDGNVDTPESDSGAFTHVYDQSAQYLVSVTADSDAGNTTATLVNTITDQTPTLGISLSDDTVEQGTSLTVTPTLTMNSLDTLNGWTVDWGDGIIDTPGSDPTTTFDHSYAHGSYPSGQSYNITVTADTSVGVVAAEDSVTITAPAPSPPPPTPPYMWISSDGPAVATQSWDLEVLTCGVSSPPSSYSVDFGDGGSAGEADETDDLGGDNIEYIASHTYAEPGLYYVNAGDPSLSQNGFFQIGDTTPSVSSVDDQTADFGSEVDVSASVSGLNINETYHAFIDWGTGAAPTAATLTAGGDGTGTISGSLAHVYEDSSASVTLYDQDGNGTGTTFGISLSSDSPDLVRGRLLAAAPPTSSSATPSAPSATSPPQEANSQPLWASVSDSVAIAPKEKDGSLLFSTAPVGSLPQRVVLFQSSTPFANEQSSADAQNSDFSDPLIPNDAWAQNDSFPFALTSL